MSAFERDGSSRRCAPRRAVVLPVPQESHRPTAEAVVPAPDQADQPTDPRR